MECSGVVCSSTLEWCTHRQTDHTTHIHTCTYTHIRYNWYFVSKCIKLNQKPLVTATNTNVYKYFKKFLNKVVGIFGGIGINYSVLKKMCWGRYRNTQNTKTKLIILANNLLWISDLMARNTFVFRIKLCFGYSHSVYYACNIIK